MEHDDEDPADLVFENDIYVITLKVLPGEVLRVEAEQKSDGALWRGDFTSGYIEDITRKTGNCKKFPVFVKMLRSAILQESDSVFVSLLTYHELEVLKARKATAESYIPRDLSNNKRYLILTYVGEFDRVHYPLPLLYEEAAESENLRRTIRRLRAEMADMKTKLLQRPEISRDAQLEGLKAYQLSEEADGHGKGQESRFEAEKARLIKETFAWKNKYKLLLAKYEAKKDCYKELQMWRKRNELLQEELKKERSNHKRSVANLMMEKVALLEEVKAYREGETRTRVKLRESESELEHLKRKVRASARDLPPARVHSRATIVPSNSRRPSPQSKGHRSSSCPTFRPRMAGYREHGGPKIAECSLPRISQKHGRRSPQPFLEPSKTRAVSGRSSFSERSASPALQSPRSASCGVSPGRSWRNKENATPLYHKHKALQKERDESPGKLLKDVKEKLSKYALMEQLNRSEISSVNTLACEEQDYEPAIANEQSLADDGSFDIEARIQALQKFLHKTK